MLLIGSQALCEHFTNSRYPKDFDYICTFEEFRWWVDSHNVVSCVPIKKNKFVVVTEKHKIFEFEIAWPNSTGMALLDQYQGVAPPQVLLTLKLSHRYIKNSPHFKKTMDDIWFLRNTGCKVPENLKEWLKKREVETYTYGHPSLKQAKKTFFTDNVEYVYDHDTVHLAVQTYEKPAYEYFKGDNEEVYCSKEKFFASTEAIRFAAVLEESYVLAIERSLVPHPDVLTPRQAFLKALEKVCTSITSGWFREYAWEHYNEIVEQFNPNYWSDFQYGVKSGLVKKHK